jgi:hypothetical protein
VSGRYSNQIIKRRATCENGHNQKGPWKVPRLHWNTPERHLLVWLIFAPHIQYTEYKAAHQDCVGTVEPRIHLSEYWSFRSYTYKDHKRIEEKHEDEFRVFLLVEFLACLKCVEQEHHSENETHTEWPSKSVGRD